MTTDVILWRMRHRASGLLMVCQIVRNELLLTVDGDPIPIDDRRIREALRTLPQHPLTFPMLVQLTVHALPEMFSRSGWQIEEEA